MDKVALVGVIVLALTASSFGTPDLQQTPDQQEYAREWQEWMQDREALRESGVEEAREGHWDPWEMDEWRDEVGERDEEWFENVEERREDGRSTTLPPIEVTPSADTTGARSPMP